MTTYLSNPIPVDTSSIRAQIDEAAQALQPGIDTTSPGTAYDFLCNLIVGLHAEQLQTLTEQLAIAFRGSLEKVDRIVQRDAVQATATGTLTRTATDAAAGPRTVAAGTEFYLLDAEGERVAFQTLTETAFTGSDASEPVDLIATLGGAGGNELNTVDGPAQTLTWYQSLTLDAPTSGGEDAEDDDAYLNRGADEKPGRAFTIVRPDDLSRWLRNQPGVDRAQVINLYNAATGTAGVGGHMTAIPIDENGAELSDIRMEQLQAGAQEIALLGGTIHITGPTDTLIEIEFAGVAEAGYDTADVEARAEQAALDFLDRSRFGLPKSGDQREWLDLRVVRYQDLVTVLNNVLGFDHYTSLTINGGTSDVTLDGPGALPSASSTATGTVTAP